MIYEFNTFCSLRYIFFVIRATIRFLFKLLHLRLHSSGGTPPTTALSLTQRAETYQPPYSPEKARHLFISPSRRKNFPRLGKFFRSDLVFTTPPLLTARTPLIQNTPSRFRKENTMECFYETLASDSYCTLFSRRRTAPGSSLMS